MQSLGVESNFFMALWYVPLVFKLAKGTHLSGVRPEGWVAQCMAQTPGASASP